MDPVQAKLAELEKKIDAIYVSAEKTRKYFLAVVIISVLVFVLPLIALPFFVGQFLSMYSDVGTLF